MSESIFICTWEERLEEIQYLGFLEGVLEGLKFRVYSETKIKIEETLARKPKQKV